MLVVMKRGATQSEIDAVSKRIQEFGITPVPLPGAVSPGQCIVEAGRATSAWNARTKCVTRRRS